VSILDFLPRDWAAYFAQAYAGEERSLAEVSPCNVSLEGFPPLLIEYGDCECLRDQISAFVRKAVAGGVEVEEIVAPGMVHVFPLFYTLTDDDAPPRKAFEHMERFVDRVMGPLTHRPEVYQGVCAVCSLWHCVPDVIVHHPCLVVPGVLCILGFLAFWAYFSYYMVDNRL